MNDNISLELKKQYINEQLRASDKVLDIQEKFRKVFFDEEIYSLKEGVPFDENILKMCLNIPLAIIKVKNIIKDTNLELINFIEIKDIICGEDPEREFTEIYIKYTKDLEVLKYMFTDHINDLNKRFVIAIEDEKISIKEEIKIFEDAKKTLCEC